MAVDPAPEQLAGIAFGRFHVLPDRREVLADGRPMKLGGNKVLCPWNCVPQPAAA